MPLLQAVDVDDEAKYGDGLNLSMCLGSSTAFVHRNTNFFLASSCRTISSICGCISGSPPAIDTIGAPDSSIAPTACSTGIRCFSTVAAAGSCRSRRT